VAKYGIGRSGQQASNRNYKEQRYAIGNRSAPRLIARSWLLRSGGHELRFTELDSYCVPIAYSLGPLTMTSFFNAAPNIRYDVPADAKAIVVLIHGMAEHSARYRPAIDFLNAQGIGCCSFDQRGHGTAVASEAERGDVVSFQDFVADATAVVETARNKYAPLPIFVWGHSMGAIIATLTAAQVTALSPGKIRGAITSSPPVAAFDVVPAFVMRLLKGLAYVIPKYRVARPFKPERLSRELQVGLRYDKDPLVPKKTSLRLLVQLADASAQCVRVARKIRVPWLALHGSDDQIAPAIGSQRLFDALASPDKQLRLWPEARHEVHNEIEPTRTEFLMCIVEWVRERT
jgi:acylglycerol lipase